MENINIEFDPVLDFKHYSDAIVKIIQGSEPKFSIGIYGEWGTGKTTLMKLVEKKINDHLLKWDSVPGEDIVSLFHFLNTYLGLSWTKAKEDIEIKKTEDEKILHISSRHNKGDYLSFTLKGSKVILDIGDKDKQRVEYLVKGDKDNPFVHLYQNNILTVWFNAWRYEREEHYALIALMKTIAYAMGEHAIYKDLKPILLKGVGIFTKGILHKLATEFLITEKEVEEFEKYITPKMELLAEVDRETIYFDGLAKIEKEMDRILKTYPNSKIVVFIDDLDRCSPKTVLEVFESTKVFLGLKGFVYVIGLSHETIAKLITAEYEKSGIKGAHYIRKIIQIPIIIPDWNNRDLEKLINNALENDKLDTKYKAIIKKDVDLITKAVELNPRELKRFINNFILAHEIYSQDLAKPVKATELLAVQALKIRWYIFYRYISEFPEFRTMLKFYIAESKKGQGSKIKFFEWLEKKSVPKDYKDLTYDLDKNLESQDLLNFLMTWDTIIFGIMDWEIYRRAAESTTQSFTGLEEKKTRE